MRGMRRSRRRMRISRAEGIQRLLGTQRTVRELVEEEMEGKVWRRGSLRLKSLFGVGKGIGLVDEEE